MDKRMSEALDRHITGNYGEDQFNGDEDEDNEDDTGEEYSNVMPKQTKMCKERNLPMFVSSSGVCFSCKKLINDTDKFHITGCHWCSHSFVD